MERFIAVIETKSQHESDVVCEALEAEGISVIVSYDHVGIVLRNHRVLVPEKFAERAFTISRAAQKSNAGHSARDLS